MQNKYTQEILKHLNLSTETVTNYVGENYNIGDLFGYLLHEYKGNYEKKIIDFFPRRMPSPLFHLFFVEENNSYQNEETLHKYVKVFKMLILISTKLIVEVRDEFNNQHIVIPGKTYEISPQNLSTVEHDEELVCKFIDCIKLALQGKISMTMILKINDCLMYATVDDWACYYFLVNNDEEEKLLEKIINVEGLYTWNIETGV